MVGSMPLLTRLYSPEDYSVLAIYVSVLSLLSVSACLRLDVAIPAAKSKSEAKIMVHLSLFISLIFSLVYFLLLTAFPNFFNAIIKVDDTVFFCFTFLIPIGCWFVSLYSCLSFWSSRNQRFKLIAVTKTKQSLASVLIQFGLSFLGAKYLGLVIGHIVYSSFGFLGFSKYASNKKDGLWVRFSFARYYLVFIKSINFIKYSSVEAVLNIGAIQVSILLLSAIVAPKEVGYLFLAMKLMQIPLSLLGSAFGQVYYSLGAEKYHDGQLSEYTLETLAKIFKIGIGPLVFIAIVAPDACSFIFGKDWEPVGEIIRWMAPWFLFQFISSPISSVMFIVDKQKQLLYLTLFSFVLRISTVIAFSIFLDEYVIEAFSLTGLVFYAVCFFYFTKVADVGLRQIYAILNKSFLFIVLPVTLGFLIIWILSL